jgi:beta-N-acetylhexosaminidase
MAGVVDYWDPVQAVVLAIRAGVDMMCMPCSLQSREDLTRLEAILQGVEAAVEEGTIPLSRIEDAVERILTVKQHRGILDWNPETDPLETALQTVGGETNREIERHMAAAAVTVVENRNETLPLRLREDSRVLMLVPYENEKAQMLVGWNRAEQAGLIPEGAQVQVVRFHKDANLDTYRQQIDWADTLIFNSEISRSGLLSGGRWESAYILEVLSYAKQMGKTTIVQSVDKPYDVQSYPDADAVLAVYGCKGSSLDPTTVLTGGVTESQAAFGPNIVAGIEVIFGVFGAEGKLPVDIPLYKEGTFHQEIVYSRGYGLHYDSLITPPEPPETEPPTEETTLPTQPQPTEQTDSQTVPEPEKAAPEKSSGKGKLWIPLVLAAVGILFLSIRKPRRGRRK